MHKTAEARLPRQTNFGQFLGFQYLQGFATFMWVFLNVISNVLGFFYHILKEGNCRKKMPNVLVFQIWTLSSRWMGSI